MYHKENEGLVSTRKMGIFNANGEVVAFVDSDDWIEPDMYENMMDKYEKEESDMISSGLTIEKNNEVVNYELDTLAEGTYEREQIKTVVIPEMMWSDTYGKRAITSSVCNKLFRTTVLKEVMAHMEPELTLGEDAAITYLFIAKADKITIFNKSWYHYIARESSMVRSLNVDSFEKIFCFEKYMKQEFEKMNLLETMNYQIEKYIKIFLIDAIRSVYDFSIETITYMFPYETIPQGSKIILYGAGVVGKSYWSCLKNGNYATVAAWIDRNYQEQKDSRMNVESPDCINEKEFDYIVISIEKESVAKSIKEWLLDKGIKKEKIIWIEPRKVC